MLGVLSQFSVQVLGSRSSLIWPDVFCFGALPVVLIWLAVRGMIAFDRARVGVGTLGTCGRCRYDLAGLENNARCPECGAAADERARETETERVVIRGGWIDVLIAMASPTIVLLVPEQATYWALRWHGFAESASRTVAMEAQGNPMSSWLAIFFFCAAAARAQRFGTPARRHFIVAAVAGFLMVAYFVLVAGTALHARSDSDAGGLSMFRWSFRS